MDVAAASAVVMSVCGVTLIVRAAAGVNLTRGDGFVEMKCVVVTAASCVEDVVGKCIV